jgi:hypothetical protein
MLKKNSQNVIETKGEGEDMKNKKEIKQHFVVHYK